MITNLLTNMIVLTLVGNYIPTNTPAFKQYAFEVMLTNAQALATKWRLDQSIMLSNNVTDFSVRAHPRQIYAGMEFGKRYLFRINRAGYVSFVDLDFTSMLAAAQAPPFDNRYGALPKSWKQATNWLTLHDAQKIAESAMDGYGVPRTELGFFEPKLREQMEECGKPTPFFKFEWESGRARCRVYVSAIVTNIVSFEFEGFEPLRLKPPTNYLELLGLPTNTIFVREIAPGKFKRFDE